MRALIHLAGLLVLLWAVCPAGVTFANDRVLTLVYKESGKPPYMGVAPDNSGLYLDMMQRATQKIGYDLRVLRLSKKRTYRLLESGEAELYASAQFRKYRSKFLIYMPNGLYRQETFWGLTRADIPRLTNVSQLNEHNLTFIVELGSSWPRKARRYGVPYSEIPVVSVEEAVATLQLGRPFFFGILQEDIEQYMEDNGIASMAELGIRVHTNCLKPNNAPLYTNFSRNSPHYSEEVNPDYDENRPLSAENFPYRLTPGSVPYRLQQALQEMYESGETKALVQKYFPDTWEEIIQ